MFNTKIRIPGYRNDVRDANGELLATAYRMEADTSGPMLAGPIAEANARLIARAPELYWWLKSIIDDLPEHRDWLNPDVEAAARDALAKARGEVTA